MPDGTEIADAEKTGCGERRGEKERTIIRTKCALAAHLRERAVCKALFPSPRGAHPRGAFLCNRNEVSYYIKKGAAFAAPFWNSCAFLLAAAESVAVSASAAAEEKQDNPKAAVISAAVAGIKTAAVATAAAQQQDDPENGTASALVTGTSTTTVCCS